QEGDYALEDDILLAVPRFPWVQGADDSNVTATVSTPTCSFAMQKAYPQANTSPQTKRPSVHLQQPPLAQTPAPPLRTASQQLKLGTLKTVHHGKGVYSYYASSEA
ncbi:hypothetical protein FRB94_012393, partial [Tulasnella sp. JGI-2019a]